MSDIEKAREKVAKLEAEERKYRDKWYDAVAALNNAQMELEALEDEENECVYNI